MVTSAIIGEAAKVIWIRVQEMKQRRIARIYSLTGQVPERAIEESIPGSGIFRDKVTKERFRLDGYFFKQLKPYSTC